jgi:hypothetical protein
MYRCKRIYSVDGHIKYGLYSRADRWEGGPEDAADREGPREAESD